MKVKKRSDCAISSALEIIGDKWVLLIVRDILFYRKKTYGEFLKSKEKIATNILSDKLEILEREGIILKHTHPDGRTKFQYSLSKKGKDLLPIIIEMIVWSDTYLTVSDRAKELVKNARKNRHKLINRILGK